MGMMEKYFKEKTKQNQKKERPDASKTSQVSATTMKPIKEEDYAVYGEKKKKKE